MVELTGTIWPGKGDYWIKGDDGNSANLRSAAVSELKRGSRIWVKGTVEYVHHAMPDDYFDEQGRPRYQLELPQAICYINVSEFKVIETP